ncbi:FAD-dependent oxidoreductase [Paracoccus methylovorus]|uniref:FAD-dependent oxidoreductase n=1 Tax=Paracoccus methylovorus TaxID=2812658 RepID=A0ABX7JLV9_9RHOB|nr:NAD(P)/FAD-dependent oxidoreductase [Paracoccus methylovorus]QRZ15105.1 FAD-dependent oxidoreductase [Paracoccus methylovorus]
MSVWDAIVIGAGPAGIGGASLLAEGGARVLLIDEAPGPGGQIWRGIETAPPGRAAILGPDYRAGAAEVARLRASGASLAFSTEAWRVEPDGVVWLRDARGLRRETARYLLIATGAMERPVPLPGWTLPGVTTIGGLQILLKREGMLPQGPLALVGTGPLVYLYAAQCLSAGKRDLVLVDTGRPGAMFAALRHLPRALLGRGPAYLAKGAGLLWRLRRGGIPTHAGAREIRIEPDAQGDLVLSFFSRGPHTLRLSRIGLHEGIIPETHLLRSLGCRMVWSQTATAFHPDRDRDLRSSLSHVHVAGDAGGIGGATVALLEGRIAAMAILDRLGRAVDPLLVSATHRARRAHLAARPLIERLYHPAPDVMMPPDEVVACRCEEVRCGEIRASLAAGNAGPNQLKAFLRCGMGPCQGRICGPTLAQLTAQMRGMTMEEAGWLTVRPPLRPVSLGEVADLVGEGP